ncbi:MAG: hypothetical protein ABWY45_06915 [Mycobacterium sp.]
MDSLFSHPYKPDSDTAVVNSAETATESPVFSDRPNQEANADRPPLS